MDLLRIVLAYLPYGRAPDDNVVRTRLVNRIENGDFPYTYGAICTYQGELSDDSVNWMERKYLCSRAAFLGDVEMFKKFSNSRQTIMDFEIGMRSNVPEIQLLAARSGAAVGTINDECVCRIANPNAGGAEIAAADILHPDRRRVVDSGATVGRNEGGVDMSDHRRSVREQGRARFSRGQNGSRHQQRGIQAVRGDGPGRLDHTCGRVQVARAIVGDLPRVVLDARRLVGHLDLQRLARAKTAGREGSHLARSIIGFVPPES